MDIHARYTCHECNQAFDEEIYFKLHKYVIDCESEFASAPEPAVSSSMKSNIDTSFKQISKDVSVVPNAIFNCSECGKSFEQESAFNTHLSDCIEKYKLQDCNFYLLTKITGSESNRSDNIVEDFKKYIMSECNEFVDGLSVNNNIVDVISSKLIGWISVGKHRTYFFNGDLVRKSKTHVHDKENDVESKHHSEILQKVSKQKNVQSYNCNTNGEFSYQHSGTLFQSIQTTAVAKHVNVNRESKSTVAVKTNMKRKKGISLKYNSGRKKFKSNQIISDEIHAVREYSETDKSKKTLAQKQHTLDPKKIHNSQTPFQCGICKKYFNRKSYLQRHNLIHTGEKPFKCDVCKKCFAWKKCLVRHLSIHTGEKPFECNVCKKDFTWKECLVQHKRIHTGETPFKCDVCKKCFASKHYLVIHMRIHTGEKPFKCDVCNKCFITKQYFINHKRIHSDVILFECDICKKCFNFRGNFIVHKRTHTNEKPFRCDVCNKRFIQKSYLTSHKIIHTGEKPFECNVCEKSFSRKRSLVIHMKQHTKQQEFDCGNSKKIIAVK